MTRVGRLNPSTDPIQAAEADHEGSKVSLRLSPLATFILEAGLQPRLRGSRTRVATELFEAAVQDWLEAQGIDQQGDSFRRKYLQWLTRQPLSDEERHDLRIPPEEGDVYAVIEL